jgi:hypothetical protein
MPVTDDDVACLSTDGDRRTATETRASERSSTIESLESGTDEAFLGSANDASDDDERGSIDRHDRHDRHDRSDTDATSVLFMSTFDGTEAKTRSPEESPEKSPDALLRETRALLNRSAPGRFGAESRFPRESNTEADDAATGRERIDTREKQGKQGSVRVPVLEAYDEAHARRKKTRGGEPSLDALRRARLAFSIPKTASAATRRTSNDARTAETSRRSSARESAETKAHTKPSQPSPCVRVPSADGAKGAQGARPPFRDVRQSATDFAKTKAASPSPRRGALAAPFERVRRRSAERAARASRSGTSFASPCHESHAAASKTLLDGATRRRLAEATATLARVEASRREKFSAAHPARASSSHGQTVSASADRARRLGDVLAEYRSVRGSSTIETARGNDAHRPTEPRFRVSDENSTKTPKTPKTQNTERRFRPARASSRAGLRTSVRSVRSRRRTEASSDTDTKTSSRPSKTSKTRHLTRQSRCRSSRRQSVPRRSPPARRNAWWRR